MQIGTLISYKGKLYKFVRSDRYHGCILCVFRKWYIRNGECNVRKLYNDCNYIGYYYIEVKTPLRILLSYMYYKYLKGVLKCVKARLCQ